MQRECENGSAAIGNGGNTVGLSKGAASLSKKINVSIATNGTASAELRKQDLSKQVLRITVAQLRFLQLQRLVNISLVKPFLYIQGSQLGKARRYQIRRIGIYRNIFELLSN